MSADLCLWLVCSLPREYPHPTDLRRFPPAWECREQVWLHREHLYRLRYYLHVYGHGDGTLARAVSETEWRGRCWELLHVAHQDCPPFTPTLLPSLRTYLGRVGPVLYDHGWTPPPLLSGLPDWRIPDPEPRPNAAGR